MTEDGRNAVTDLIKAGVLAGAYLAEVRKTPLAERGLMKMYWKHHARTAILCDAVGASTVMATGSQT